MLWISLVQIVLVLGLAVSGFEYFMKRRSAEGEEKKTLAVHLLIRIAVLSAAMFGLDHFFG
ncbi:hypothetical protein [Desulfocurvibacter africanus]|uniref:hypothetical protein n=1 Tax=Desulfocurvibacter africanus TaxID=873 RepID=UPI00040E0001|nr:hypothetical protein [Desulfocurvibacter africanus]